MDSSSFLYLTVGLTYFLALGFSVLRSILREI